MEDFNISYDGKIDHDSLHQDLEKRLTDNPCRGIALGLTEDEKLLQVSWIMGRSANSQNRIYIITKGALKTEPADSSRVEDPKLIIYTAMRSYQRHHVVGNGDQVDTAIDWFQGLEGKSLRKGMFFSAMKERYCEPDVPIFTPRITGYQSIFEKNRLLISILRPDSEAKEHWKKIEKERGFKKENFGEEGMTDAQVSEAYNGEISMFAGLDHHAFPTKYSEYNIYIPVGTGYCATTYKPGHETLDTFEGEPFRVSLKGTIKDIMDTFWNALDPRWRVSLGARILERDNIEYLEPINKFDKIS